MGFTDQLKWFFDELTRLAAEREAIDSRTERVLEIIGILQTLSEDEQGWSAECLIPQLNTEAGDGFTDRVRQVLKSSPRAFTAIQVRNALQAADPDKDSKIVLIHTHNTLKRLKKQGEVDELPTAEGRTAYRWKYAYASTSANAYADMLRSVGELAIDPNKLPPDIAAMVKRPEKK